MEKGNILAINNLGVLYDRNKNYKKAREYYLMAINKKCSFAYNNLGNLYEDIYQDYEKAKELYSKCFKETKNTEALICKQNFIQIIIVMMRKRKNIWKKQ
ncbi:tetratricopeptide repeat protein [Leptotrichia sp. HSP-342]|uniref:Tetratricopeptide repeat protein n=1 Tax=Leptotrichia mesophila TaxID=3239303 RepID=A0AB39VD89_9FUSO